MSVVEIEDTSIVLEENIKNSKPNTLKSKSNDITHDSSKFFGKSVRINIEKFNKVINLVDELVINGSRLIQISREQELDDLSNTTSIVEKTISDL